MLCPWVLVLSLAGDALVMLVMLVVLEKALASVHLLVLYPVLPGLPDCLDHHHILLGVFQVSLRVVAPALDPVMWL